jgi:hypothetical protein
MKAVPGSSAGSETPFCAGFRRAIVPGRKALHGATALLLGLSFLAGMLGGLPAAAKEKKPQKELSGTVIDRDDNPIDGAAVTLTDLTTGKKIATYTDREGRYLFAELEVTRDYEVQATYQGVNSRSRKLSQVDPRNRIVFHLRIPPEEEEP